MGKDLFDASAAVREMFMRASEVSGLDLERILFAGTEDELKQTEITQVAVTLVNLAAAAVLREKGVHPAGCAGFSLGEYAALVSAGVVSVDDVFPLVKTRGELSTRAAADLAADGDAPGMAAVIGLDPEAVASALSGVEAVYPANLNSPKQTVIAGRSSALDGVEQSLKDAGARRVIRLKVTGAFHTPLMQSIVDDFEAALAGVEFADPSIALYSNVTGGRVVSGAQARRLCLEQLTNPVQWVSEERSVAADGYDDVLEVGPGTVLAGLWKALPDSVPCRAAGTLAAIGELPFV
jgi:[acyl-carrier-protein] S-malonyltransferase